MPKKRNPVASELSDPVNRQRIKEVKRRHLLDRIHEQEAIDALKEIE